MKVDQRDWSPRPERVTIAKNEAVTTNNHRVVATATFESSRSMPEHLVSMGCFSSLQMEDSLMTIFNKRTNVQRMENDFEKLNERVVLLTGKRAACALVLEEARSAGQQHLLTGNVEDEKTGTALRDRVSGAQTQLADLDAALGALAGSMAEAEQGIAAERRRITCEADAASLAAIVVNLEKNLKPLLEVSRALAADLESLNDFRYQAAGLAAYFRHFAGDGEIALRIVIDDFSGAVAAVADGTQKINIGKTPAVPAAATPPALPPKDHFTYSTPSHAPVYRGH